MQELQQNSSGGVGGGLLGMPGAPSWLLQGPYADRSLVRDALSFDLARAAGAYPHAPHTA
jgi:hypothetical protein